MAIDMRRPAIDMTADAKACYEAAKAAGWWDEYLPDRQHERFDIAMVLICSELIEAMEGDRKNLDDDHLPDQKMRDVEMADTAIRILDTFGALIESGQLHECRISGPAIGWAANEIEGRPFPEQIMVAIRAASGQIAEFALGRTLAVVIAICEAHGIDLVPLIARKLAYNKDRADHKREARQAAGGKAY